MRVEHPVTEEEEALKGSVRAEGKGASKTKAEMLGVAVDGLQNRCRVFTLAVTL